MKNLIILFLLLIFISACGHKNETTTDATPIDQDLSSNTPAQIQDSEKASADASVITTPDPSSNCDVIDLYPTTNTQTFLLNEPQPQTTDLTLRQLEEVYGIPIQGSFTAEETRTLQDGLELMQRYYNNPLSENIDAIVYADDTTWYSAVQKYKGKNPDEDDLTAAGISFAKPVEGEKVTILLREGSLRDKKVIVHELVHSLGQEQNSHLLGETETQTITDALIQ